MRTLLNQILRDERASVSPVCDRVTSPTKTLNRIRDLCDYLDITRIGELTGLDTIGIPVAFATRPNSQTLSVSQGKGIDRDAALVSAAMESAECAIAESVPDDLIRMSSSDAALCGTQVLELELVARASPAKLTSTETIEWCTGVELSTQKDILVPWGLVGLSHKRSAVGFHDSFEISSDGLASGNSISEAVFHGICELIERDAFALFQFLPIDEMRKKLVDISCCEDPVIQDLLSRIRSGGQMLSVLEITSEIDVPCYMAIITPGDEFDSQIPFLSWAKTAGGFGCHPSPIRALTRAITEAAQSRLTTIAGARDDLRPQYYTDNAQDDAAELFQALNSKGTSQMPSCSFDQQFISQGISSKIEWLLGKLADCNIEEVVVVSLVGQPIGIHVVRVIIPNLEVGLEGNNTRLLKRGIMGFMRYAR